MEGCNEETPNRGDIWVGGGGVMMMMLMIMNATIEGNYVAYLNDERRILMTPEDNSLEFPASMGLINYTGWPRKNATLVICNFNNNDGQM